MSNSADVTIVPVYDAGAQFSPEERAAPKPRATLWDRIQNWYWNWKRRPEVRRKQRELLQIAEDMKRDIKVQLLPQLWQVRLVCPTCKDNFTYLRGEVFVSTMKTVLEKMRCPNHADAYLQFLIAHAPNFERNDKLAAWINGFSD